MAIDLASSSSPFEFQNMLPLDVLAAVASEKLRDEIHFPDNLKIKTSSNIKRNIKKSSTSILTFEDIKNMPAKLLIDKFSEMTSDELTKKYSYKCTLLPEKCSLSFKSFGNEKKACDEMKSHLLLHIQQLTMEYESSEGNSDTVFIPKSPNSYSKHTEKFSKKFLKKQQSALNCGLPRSNSSKLSKKNKNSTYFVKTLKKKLNDNKKYISPLKNGYSKIQDKNVSSVYLKDNSPLKPFYDDSIVPDDDKYFLSKKVKREIPEDFDEEYDNEHYSSYSRHLKIAFFTDVEVREEIYESQSSSEQGLDLNDSNSSHEDVLSLSSETVSSSPDKMITFLQDHNYVCLDDAKCNKVTSSSELKNIPRKYEDPLLYPTRNELPPYVIKTPPFPFIHTPLLPEVAEIVEVRLQDSKSIVDKYSFCVDYLCDTNTSKSDVEETLTDDYSSDHEDRYSDEIFYKMNNASGSVLECVENIENKKHSGACVPKNEISARENDENLENLQKDEKELALKYIAKLHSKGKKKYSDSLICQICPDKHFTAQATLIHHYRSHAGIKPYICKLCSSKFTRQHSLNYHMLIHQNRSRFTCDFCGRTFRHPSHYKEHLRRHTGETPYHCTDCNMHFKTRNTFKRHLKTRHGKLLTAGGIEDLNTE